jgi:hyperosmotically inducible periplasmic protein
MYKTLPVAIAALALALGACEERPANQPGTTMPPPSRTPARAPDNTGINERDRDNATLTPGDQSESEADRAITADVRRTITNDDTMSTSARNIKIITSNGVVTLRGPVASQAEKDVIEAKARTAKGVTQVDNQLEVVDR